MATLEEKQARAELKAKKKEYKKRIISKYGYLYYLRDKTWNHVKNQKEFETREEWKKRLDFYGFTTDGIDIKTGKQHHAKPLVYEEIVEEAPIEAIEETPVAEAAPVEEAPAEEAIEEATEEIAEETVEEVVEETAEPEEEIKLMETVVVSLKKEPEETAIEEAPEEETKEKIEE